MRRPRCDWRTIRVLVVMAMVGVLVLVLMACGEQAPDEMDRRYQECTDAGGDFEVTGPNDWSCTNTDTEQETE